MARDRADLHVHSKFSDGRDAPAEIVQAADALGLGGIALTDHDTLDGLSEFMECDTSDKIQRVPGVEISTEYLGAEAHLLGYYVPYGPSTLKTRLRSLEKSRKERLPKMVKKLEAIGVEVDKDCLDESLKGVGSPGRPHLARLLVDTGVVDSWQEAFDKYLATGRPAYVKKERMDSLEAKRLIRRLHGVPVLAHPLTVRTENLRDFVADLVQAGLAGLEAAYDYGHLSHISDSGKIEELADELGLLKTGGSDYHGDTSHAGLGEVTAPVHVISMLRKKVGEDESH